MSGTRMPGLAPPDLAPPDLAAPAQTSLGSIAHFARPRGPDLLARTAPLTDWIAGRVAEGTWPCERTLHTGPSPTAVVEDATGATFEGINFASQDYLGLAGHPDVVDAAVEAARRYGVHSGGSAALAGGSRASQDLEGELGELVGAEHVLLFPTGWAAGFGTILGLVRRYDHVLLDELAHACLHQGAALSPVQVATVRAALRLVRSPEGEQLRARLLDVSCLLRTELAARGISCLGVPGAINPVPIGSEAVARPAAGRLASHGVLANLAEFPAVARGTARLRLQAMATHTPDQVRTAARIVADAIEEAVEAVDGR